MVIWRHLLKDEPLGVAVGAEKISEIFAVACDGGVEGAAAVLEFDTGCWDAICKKALFERDMNIESNTFD